MELVVRESCMNDYLVWLIRPVLSMAIFVTFNFYSKSKISPYVNIFCAADYFLKYIMRKVDKSSMK